MEITFRPGAASYKPSGESRGFVAAEEAQESKLDYIPRSEGKRMETRGKVVGKRKWPWKRVGGWILERGDDRLPTVGLR